MQEERDRLAKIKEENKEENLKFASVNKMHNSYEGKDKIGDPIILWWTHFTGEPGASRQCGANKCFFTNNRTYRHHRNLEVSGRRAADPPENCHLNVKIAKNLTFFSKKIAKNC